MIQALERRSNSYTEDRRYEEIQDQKLLYTTIDETRTIDGTGIQIEKQDNSSETNTNESMHNEQMAKSISKAK